MENHDELKKILQETKKSEELRLQAEEIHSALLSIHEKIKTSPPFQSSPSKTKLSSSVAPSKLRTSSIILSGTEFVEINNASVKNRINLYKDYMYALKLRKVSAARKTFFNILTRKPVA